MKTFKGYDIEERNGVCYMTYGFEGDVLKSDSFDGIKELIRTDIKRHKTNKYYPKTKDLIKKNLNKEWVLDILDLMDQFGRTKYFYNVINDTIKENPGKGDDVLFRMAHKKLISLI